MWITAFMCGGAGVLLGSRLSVRGILLIVSGILAVVMFFSSALYAISILGTSRSPGFLKGLLACAFSFLPALSSFLAFCLLLAKQIQRKPPFPSYMFGLFLLNAWAFSLVFGIVGIASPYMLLFVLPFWACVVLAWRLRRDWQAAPSAVPPPLPVEMVPEENREPEDGGEPGGQ